MSGSGQGTAIGSVSGPTDIVNRSLARIGAPSIKEYQTDASVPAQKARLFYDADRRALLRRFWWRFAQSRASLAVSDTTPAFEYDYQYALPADFLALRYIWDTERDEPWLRTPYPAALEGLYLLSDETSMDIVYTANVTDAAQFDPLFEQVLVLRLALDLVFPLVKLAVVGAADRIKMELDDAMKQAKQMDLAEQNLIGRVAHNTWLDARHTSRAADPAHLRAW